MYFNSILLAIFLAIPFVSVGQLVAEQWQNTLPTSDRNSTMHRMIQSVNGDLLVVGEATYKDGETDGFLAFFDAQSGSIKGKTQIYGRADGKDNIVQDIVQVEDGGFYLLCNTTDKKSPTRSYLIRTDEEGIALSTTPLEEGSLKRMIYLYDDQLLLIGKKQEKDGKIWLMEYASGKILTQRFIGQGRYAQLKGVALTANQDILLCGTTERVKKVVNEGAIWLAKVNRAGVLIKEDIIDEPDRLYFQNATASFDGNLLLAGGEVKNWLIEVDDQLNAFINEDVENDTPQLSDGLLRNYTDQHLLFTRSFYQEQNKAIYLRGLKPEDNINITASGQQFDVADLLYSFEQQYIVGGNANEGFRIVSLTDSERANFSEGIKGGLAVIEIAVSNFSLQDQNRNGILESGERAAVVFDLKNTGTIPLTRLKVNIVPKSVVSGINYFEERFVSYLGVGETRRVSVPFNAGKELSKGQKLDFVLQIKENGKSIDDDLPFSIRTEEGREEIIIDWDEIGERTIRSEEGSTEVRLKIYTDRQLQRETIKAHANGVVLEDSKRGEGKLEKSDISKFYTFTQTIQLDTGENIIYYEVLGDGFRARTDTIHIFYEPSRPNLHVLAIGPTYNDLEYPAQDAKDFAEAMRAQKGKGFYNQVFVEELVIEEKTSERKIKFAFEDLSVRYLQTKGEDKITSNDVLVVFISSHGEVINGSYKILPSNFQRAREKTTSVDYEDEILYHLNLINCKKLLFIDACLSGNAKSGGADAKMTKELLRLNETAPGLSSIVSCGKEELSYEDQNWKNGAFTEAFLEALENKAVVLHSGSDQEETIRADQSGDGLLSLEELYAFLQKRVPNLVEKKWGSTSQRSQRPVMNRKELKNQVNFFVVPKSE
jgi:hypothetical protein